MKVKVRILREVPQLRLHGQALGPFEEGEEAELWSWQARALVKRGEAEIEEISAVEIRRKIISEENSQELGGLPENFYPLIRENILRLRSAGREEEARELKSLTLALVDVRLSKLLRMIFDPESAPAVPEERFLLNQLFFVLNSWGSDLEKFLETGEEANPHDEGRPV
jgi:hypothetical protein